MLSATVLHIALAMGLPPIVVSDMPTPTQSETRAKPGKEKSWTAARFAVGDVIEEDVELHSGFPGLDLPWLEGTEAYVRGNENIYCINVETMRVKDVIPIGTVILY